MERATSAEALQAAPQARRSRRKRTRTGKVLVLTDRDLALFRVLAEYRYLRSTYLHAFVGGASETRFKERLGDLFHEGFPDRPERQWELAAARYQPAVYELGERGRRVLAGIGGETKERTYLSSATHRQFLHANMICECLASIELGTHARNGLRFIAWWEIAAKLPPATAQSAMPFKIPIGPGAIIPDGMFGLEYSADGRTTYRFFALEADRGTMPVSRMHGGQTSYLGKLALYREIIEKQLYRSHWGIPNLFMLTVTTDPARLADMLRKLDGERPLFLMRAMPSRALCCPALTLLGDPWERPGLPPFHIDR
jgi:hypothetical protein